MTSLSASRYLIPIALLLLYFKAVCADFNVSFASENVDKDPNFESLFAFYGDAKLVSGRDKSVQLSGSVASSAGTVLYKEPIKLFERNSRKMVSFVMNFVFSLSSENGVGLAFVMAPVGNPVHVFDGGLSGVLAAGGKVKFLAVEFETSRDNQYGDVNGNHGGVDLASLISVKISNFSSVNSSLSSGEKLQSWIDYEANSKRLEVRLAKLGEIKPPNPLLFYPVDLSRMRDKADVLFSLSSASGNSSRKCNLYSWSLKLSSVPNWMHSEPLDPAAFVERRKELKVHEKSDCALRIIAALIFGTGCGALGALLVLFIWTLLGYKRPVVPEDYVVQPVGFEYTKSIKDGKNQLGA